ncbi:MAG: gamma-glutamylcyclotransferase family protein [Nitrospiraceae bacterium]
MDATLYFAYGSNMDEQQMSRRCPNAAVVGVATLLGHQLIINTKGFATVVPLDTGVVIGLLWNLARTDEEALDDYEGVGRGLYEKSMVVVQTHDGDKCRALAYVATTSTMGAPWKGYMERIVAAAERHDFPATYVEQLRRWQRNDDR